MADNYLNLPGVQRLWAKIKEYVDSALGLKLDADAYATDSAYGIVKTNSAQAVTLDAEGKLVVGGRLGSTEEGGLYYPLNTVPEYVGPNNLLISEATNLKVNSTRVFALFGGAGLTLRKSAAAGATLYEVQNSWVNRFTCAAARNGYATIEQATAGTNIVRVTNVYLANDAGKTPLVPYSGATDDRNNIIIETDRSVNPDAATTKLRIYGTMSFDSSLHIGQGVGCGGVTGQGKLLQLGQSQCSLKGNSILVGNGQYNDGGNSALLGRQHINTQMAAFLAGQYHETTNGKVGVAAVGSASIIGPTTAFAVGNGTANTARSNIFEVRDASGATELIVKSPNGTSYKIAVDDSGNVTATAL